MRADGPPLGRALTHSLTPPIQTRPFEGRRGDHAGLKAPSRTPAPAQGKALSRYKCNDGYQTVMADISRDYQRLTPGLDGRVHVGSGG